MVSKIEDHLIVNMQLLKITGLNQLLSPQVRKFFGYNIFTYVLHMMILIITVSVIIIAINIYYFLGDYLQVIQYISVFLVGLNSLTKLYCFIQNSEQIWNCLQLTSIHSLCYEYHNRQLLESGLSKSKLLSLIFVSIWLVIATFWMLSPFIFSNYYIEIKVKNAIYHYHYNIMDLYFPAKDTFYNDNFLTYYCIESLITMLWGYGLLIFDIILMSMCVAFSYQLRSIAHSYSTFGILHNRPKSNETVTAEHDELKLIYDFKTLIRDQQLVFGNIRTIYKILYPPLFFQICVDSLNIILISCIFLMNYLEGMSFVSIFNIKYCLTSCGFTFHLFCICALSSDINVQTESMNFAMYCSDWTTKSLRYKKLLLYTLRMNSADNLQLKLTRERVINFEMFSKILKTTYSVLSIMVKKD